MSQEATTEPPKLVEGERREETCGCLFVVERVNEQGTLGERCEPCIAHGLGAASNYLKQFVNHSAMAAKAMQEFHALLVTTAEVELKRLTKRAPPLAIVRGKAAERVLGKD